MTCWRVLHEAVTGEYRFPILLSLFPERFQGLEETLISLLQYCQELFQVVSEIHVGVANKFSTEHNSIPISNNIRLTDE